MMLGAFLAAVAGHVANIVNDLGTFLGGLL